MKITSARLFEIAAMPAEAMAATIRFVAEELQAEERKRELAAKRQQRYRQAHGDADVTSQERYSDAQVTPLARVEDKPLPSREVLNNTPPVPPSDLQEHPSFDAFWQVYPKRDGNADRKGAVKAFKAAAKREAPETIISGARAYAAHCKEKGKVGTEFVKQARSWLNAELWQEWAQKDATAAPIVPQGFYVTYGTDAGDAWDAYFKTTKGISAPRDARGGWWHKTEWPPEHHSEAA